MPESGQDWTYQSQRAVEDRWRQLVSKLLVVPIQPSRSRDI